MENQTKKNFLQKANAISISTSLAFIALGTSGLTTSCTNSDNASGDYEEVELLTKGVKSYIQETSPGEFKISKEDQTQASDTEAIVTYLDGHTENIATSRAQIMIEDEIRYNPDSLGKIANLPNALLYGGMGYFLANLPGSKLAKYRNDGQISQNTNPKDTIIHRNGGHGFGFFPLFWMSRAAFYSGNRVQESMAASRVRTTRPIAGRSGFFKSSGRGGFFG
ncbi:MAG: hypothetical protein V4683_10775 [Bacteroidota bacterium]